MLETLANYTIRRIGSTPTFLYFDSYLRSLNIKIHNCWFLVSRLCKLRQVNNATNVVCCVGSVQIQIEI